MKRRAFLVFSAAAGVGLSTLFGPSAARAWADPVEVSTLHPRLLINNFDALRTLVATDPDARNWYAKVKLAADAVLEEPVSIYELPDGVRLLSVSREVQLRVYLLSMAYAVEGTANYRDRLWSELQAVCTFPDWHPPHFLDVAEMTHAVAIGYDWWYDEWTDDQRTTMADALINFGLKPGLTVYAKDPWGHDFPRWANNWNVVCNSALILGALAVADRDADTANSVINNALASLPLALALYSPDGGWPEGMEYWAYATKYLVVAMASLTTATGNDSGISESAGISTTVDFPIHLSGPTGAAWNYYDGSSSAKSPSEIFYLANTYARPDYAWYAKQGADSSQPSWDELPLYLLWYDPTKIKSPADTGAGLDARFTACAVAAARSGWQRRDAVYVAGKGGDNATSHSNLDIGTWVYEALGQRWFVDLGSDDYNLPGYFTTGANGQRWTYYRTRTEGQNTLLVSPNQGGGQPVDAVGTLIGHGANPVESWFAIDGSASHELIKTWHRGWRLSGSRRAVIIQDELTTTEPVDTWWFAHTAAKVSISANGQSATLSMSGKKLLVRITVPGSATLVAMQPKPLWTSPDPAGQSTNPGVTRLAIRFRGVISVRLAVELIPLYDGVPVGKPSPITPIDRWTAPALQIATVSSIDINNQTIPGFAADNFTYGVDLSGSPKITATGSDQHTAVRVIGQAGQAVRVVATKPGTAKSEYLLWHDTPLGLGNFPSTIIASSDDGDVPENTMDGDPDTRWSAQGDGQWIAYDMGSDGPITSIKIAWFSGSTRSTIFDVEAAADGAVSWTKIFSGRSSGTTDGFESYQLTASTARYLRIVGHGNTSSDWNSIAEVEIVGRTVSVTRAVTLDSLTLDIPPVPLGTSVRSKLTGTMTDGSAADLSSLKINYETLDADVATVSDDGTVTGVAIGATSIAVIGQTDDHRLLHSRTPVQVADPNRPRFQAVADTYVRDGSYADNVMLGDDQALVIKYASKVDQGFNRRGFIAFSPTAQSRTVKQVLLHFQAWVADSNGTEIDLTLRLATSQIDEKTTTWNNQPSLGDQIGSLHVTSDATWYAVDVTAGLLDLAQPGRPVTVAIVQEPATGEGLATQIPSRESGIGSYLEVVLQ